MCQGADVTPSGRFAIRPYGRRKGTLTPLIPLSLRAYKGEGEIRIEGRMGALHPCGPLIQYWGEGGMGYQSGSGIVDEKELTLRRRRCFPLVWYCGEGRDGFPIEVLSDGGGGDRTSHPCPQPGMDSPPISRGQAGVGNDMGWSEGWDILSGPMHGNRNFVPGEFI